MAPFDWRVALPDASLDAVPLVLDALPTVRCVLLLADADDRPVQLLATANLRSAVRRRLDAAPSPEPSKRIDYRDVVRAVHFRRVDSDFEADLVYWQAARSLFPDRYLELVNLRPTSWLHIDPDGDRPRWTRTTDLAAFLRRPGVLLGPLESPAAAGELMDRLDSAFELCRYPAILADAPHGKPCAYKDMGRCPAPCDGSISLPAYRQMVRRALHTLAEPGPELDAATARMRDAAAALAFETAGRIKQYVDELRQLGSEPWRKVRPLSDFDYLVITPVGRRENAPCKLFRVAPGHIAELCGVMNPPGDPAELLELIRRHAANTAAAPDPLDAARFEQLALAAQHLLRDDRRDALWLPVSQLTTDRLRAAFQTLQNWARHRPGRTRPGRPRGVPPVAYEPPPPTSPPADGTATD